jgi:DNA repair protein RadC
MPKILELPKHLRPREKLMEKGAENLSDRELLAILLRTGREGKSAIDVAAEILHHYPIDKLAGMNFSEVTKIKGINEGKACTLLSAFELCKRGLLKFDDCLPMIDSPSSAVAQLSDLRTLKKEHFVALYLNARNQLVHKETISVGTLNASLVHPREVFEPAVRLVCASIILAHNHPSNDCTKSPEDVQITRRLQQAGEILGIEVVDHLIITQKGFVSFKAQHWL